MRRPFCLALVSLVLLGGRAGAARYTLEQLIAKVSAEYPGVLAARESVDSARAQLSQAQRQWAPNGDLNFWMTGAGNVRCADVHGYSSPDRATREANCATTNVVDLHGGGTQTLADQLDNIAPIHGVALNFSLSVVQPLYTFGKIEAATGAAKAQVEVAKAQVDAARADAIFNAIRAYWGLKWARAAKDVLDEGIAKLKEWITKISDEMDSTNKGNYTEADLARLKVALDNAELVRLDVARGLAIARAGMKVLTGDPQADVDDSELELTEASSRPVEYYEDAARLHRPEARLIDAGISAAHYWKRWKFSEMLPDIAISSSFNYGYASSVDNPANAFLNHANSLGASFTLVAHTPLDFGVRLGRLSQAAADERAAKERRRQALGGIEIEIDKAYADHEEAREREKKLSHAEKVARGWYSIVDRNMAQGITISTDARELTDAARTYFDFRVRHLQAILDANMTLAFLRRTTGVE